MAKYEILYIIRPNIEEEAKNALVARFDSILTDNGATVVESKDWEKRRLAYEIQDFREGLYHIVNVEANDALKVLMVNVKLTLLTVLSGASRLKIWLTGLRKVHWLELQVVFRPVTMKINKVNVFT